MPLTLDPGWTLGQARGESMIRSKGLVNISSVPAVALASSKDTKDGSLFIGVWTRDVGKD